MKPRIHSRPLARALAAVALWGLTSSTPGIAQSRQSGKPGSRAAAPAPRAQVAVRGTTREVAVRGNGTTARGRAA